MPTHPCAHSNPFVISDALKDHAFKGLAANMTQQRHEQQWLRANLRTLRACSGVPTIVVPHALMQLKIPAASELLAAALQQIGERRVALHMCSACLRLGIQDAVALAVAAPAAMACSSRLHACTQTASAPP